MASRAAGRLAAAMLHQNACLRRSIGLEFASISATGTPSYAASMSAYRRQLLDAVDANEAALRTVFGPAATGILSDVPVVGPAAAALWNDWRLTLWPPTDVYDNLGSVWRHLAKDWTAEGEQAQGALRHLVVELVHAECSRMRRQLDEGSGAGASRNGPFRVLIPGSGQGRLAYSVASALQSEDAEVVGMERSSAQLGFAQHMMRGEALTFHPWLDCFANNLDAHSRLAALTTTGVTDGAPANLTLVDSDFLAVGESGGPAGARCDVCVTSFFLDCLDDLSDGVRSVHDALRPGGLWVFAGPLHYQQAGAYVPRPAATLEHFLHLASDHGFVLERPPELLPAPYVSRPNAFLSEADWTVPLFTARRVAA